MREIKFRAWDGKQMIDGVQPRLYQEEPTCMSYDAAMQFFEPMGTKRYWYEVRVKAIMQFTGLRDKNGKEIYESDIVNEHGINKIIEYRGSGFGTYDGKDFITYSTSWEVIGNVWEHPEFLNSETNDKRSVATKSNSSNADDKQKN